MINPETLDLSTLPWLPLDAKSAFPKQSAIYFAIDSQSNIQYIGRSGNVKQRWLKHHKFDDLQAIGNIRIAYLFMDADLLPSVEAALIDWFEPPLNTVGKYIPSERNPNHSGAMRAFISIAKWYPKSLSGNYLPINSVYQKIEGTPNEVGRHTLRTALDGRLDRIHTDNLVKLAQLCSMWSGEHVTINDLVVVEN